MKRGQSRRTSMIPASRPSSWRQRFLWRAGCVLAAVAAVVSSPCGATAVPPDSKIASSASPSTRGDENILIASKDHLRERQQQPQQQQQQQELEGRLAVVVPVSDVRPALRRIASWSTICREGDGHPVDLILYLENEEAHATFHKAYSGSERESVLLDTLGCFQGLTAVTGKTIYQIFTDTSVRQLFDKYDAIAVVEWEHVEVLEGSFERLYRAAFDQKRSGRSWWLIAADAPPLDAWEAQERRHQLLERNFIHHDYDDEDDMAWTINGKAVIYNNRSPELRGFLARDVSPLLHDLPFDVALWATISFSPSTDNRWGGIMLRVVPVNNLVVSLDTERIMLASDRPIFLDISSTSVGESTHNSADTNAMGASRVRHENIAAAKADRGGGVPQHDQTQIRLDVSKMGVGRQNDHQDDHNQQEQDGREHVEHHEEALVQELAGIGSLPDGSGGPFADHLTSENLCVFVPGYQQQRRFIEVTVESVLRFMPGVRVAVAVDPAEIDDYQLSMGHLRGVVLTRSIDVKHSAITADLRCGEDTEIVLYLEPGTLLSRPFAKEDTHDPVTGELLVMHTKAAKAGPRHMTFAVSAREILGVESLPAFTAGTDLILPVSANRDVRDKLVLKESKSADWRIHLHAMEHNCFESEVHVPQILASMAFMKRRPGVKFVSSNPEDRDIDGVETQFDAFDSVDAEVQPLVLKPRFGCQVYSEVYYTDDRSMPLVLGKDDLLFLDNGEQNVPQALRAVLGRFILGEEACTSGLARLPWSTLVSPGGFASFGGGDGAGRGAGAGGSGSGGRWAERDFDNLNSPSSALPSADIGLYDHGFGCHRTVPCFLDEPDAHGAEAGGGGAAAISRSEVGHQHVPSAADREYDFGLLSTSAGADDDNDSVSYPAVHTGSETAGAAAAEGDEPAGSFYSTFELKLNDDNNDFLPGIASERTPLRFVQPGLSSEADATAIAAISAANRAGVEQDHYDAPSMSTYTAQGVYDDASPSFPADQQYDLGAYSTFALSSGGVDGRRDSPIDSITGRELDDDFYPFGRAGKSAPVRPLRKEKSHQFHFAAAAAATSTAAADGENMHSASYDDDFVVNIGGEVVSLFPDEVNAPKATEDATIAASSTAAGADAAAGSAAAAAAAAATTGTTAVAHGGNLGALRGQGYGDISNMSADESGEDGQAFFPIRLRWSELLVDAVRRAREALS